MNEFAQTYNPASFQSFFNARTKERLRRLRKKQTSGGPNCALCPYHPRASIPSAVRPHIRPTNDHPWSAHFCGPLSAPGNCIRKDPSRCTEVSCEDEADHQLVCRDFVGSSWKKWMMPSVPGKDLSSMPLSSTTKLITKALLFTQPKCNKCNAESQ